MSEYYIILLAIMSYLLGSIPFGKLVARTHHVDIQKRGSGNIGFANVRRILGWRAGLITLTGDIVKGLLPTYLALYFFGLPIAFFIGLLAILGHIFPIWLGFRGGKGIATGLGLVLAIQPIAALAGAATYIIASYLTRASSRGSLIGLAVTAITAISLQPASWWQYVILLLIALWALRHNLTGRVPNYES